MAMASPKRVKVSPSSSAMRFALSPLALSKSAAVAAKLQDPAHTDLRAISIDPLSVMAYQVEGYTVCVSPLGTTSNKRFSEVCSLEQQYHLYVTLLGSSPKVCEVDIVAFVLKYLDYFLKQIVAEELQNSPTSQDFEKDLHGPYKERPFQTTDGNSVRYSILLLFVGKMKTKAMGFEAVARLNMYEGLLLRCEEKLLLSLDASGAAYTQEEKDTLLQHLREELTDFLHGEMKGDRDIASHIFCDLLWVETRGPLQEHDLHDPHFPGLRNVAFDLSRPACLEAMALKVLVLKDLQARFDSNKIGKFSHEVTKAGLKLVNSCIRRNVVVSRKVVCGDMQSIIPGLAEGSESDLVELDPPPSMTLLRS